MPRFARPSSVLCCHAVAVGVSAGVHVRSSSAGALALELAAAAVSKKACWASREILQTCAICTVFFQLSERHARSFRR